VKAAESVGSPPETWIHSPPRGQGRQGGGLGKAESGKQKRFWPRKSTKGTKKDKPEI